VISATTSFLYVYDMATLKPAGRIKIGDQLQLETATTDTADEKLYLASSTDHSVYVIDARTEAVAQVPNVGLYPWGTHILDSKDNYCH
jgi:YVTN family beta-propeller protein